MVASGWCGGDETAEYDEASGCYKNLTWTLDDEGTLTISGTGAMADYVMDMSIFGMETVGETAPWLQWMPSSLPATFPELVIEEGVTTIGDYAFNVLGLLVTPIPDSVISIGAGAFGSCAFPTSITIPESVTTIGDYAFQNCTNLTDVSIPAGVTSIGVGAFSICANIFTDWYCLTNISVDADNPNYCSVDGVLYSKDMTLLAAYPSGKADTAFEIPASVTAIGGYALSGCSSLTSVMIPDGVTTIGDYAISYCNGLTSVTIPASVTDIGGYAFIVCPSLTEINVDAENPNYCSVDGVLYSKDMKLLVAYPGGKTETAVTIPASVTSIGDYAFFDESAYLGWGSLTDVYFDGTEAQWNAITIGAGNDALTSAAVHYAPAVPMVSATNVTAYPGDEVTVDIVLANNPGIVDLLGGSRQHIA